MSEQYNDYPFDEIVAAVEQHIKNGAIVHQKFTCENCNRRLTIDTPNKLYTHGKCDYCGHVTDIKERGCNYLLVLSTDRRG